MQNTQVSVWYKCGNFEPQRTTPSLPQSLRTGYNHSFKTRIHITHFPISII